MKTTPASRHHVNVPGVMFTFHQHCRQPGFTVKNVFGRSAKPRFPPVKAKDNSRGGKVCMIHGCAAVRAENRSAAHRGAAGRRRSTHLSVKSSTGKTGKSEESRRNTGQWLVSLLCLAVISFKFTWPAAYLSLQQREKRMERLRAKPPLSKPSLGTCVALEQVCSLSCRPPPRLFAARHSKRATRVNGQMEIR